MTYRSIDLQVSVPRTAEKSPLQSYIQHKPAADQSRLEGDSVKQTELLRVKNTPVEQSGHPNINGHRLKEDGSHFKKGRRRPHDAAGTEEESITVHDPVMIKHPYKGKHIDITF